jgi:hypothetical protein
MTRGFRHGRGKSPTALAGFAAAPSDTLTAMHSSRGKSPPDTSPTSTTTVQPPRVSRACVPAGKVRRNEPAAEAENELKLSNVAS